MSFILCILRCFYMKYRFQTTISFLYCGGIPHIDFNAPFAVMLGFSWAKRIILFSFWVYSMFLSVCFHSQCCLDTVYEFIKLKREFQRKWWSTGDVTLNFVEIRHIKLKLSFRKREKRHKHEHLAFHWPNFCLNLSPFFEPWFESLYSLFSPHQRTKRT